MDTVKKFSQSKVRAMAIKYADGFQKISVSRSRNFFKQDPEKWEGLLHMGVGLAGEVGELANLIKKLHRKMDNVSENTNWSDINTDDIASEVGDVYIYLDIIASAFGINVIDAAINKFNGVSDKNEASKQYKV